MVRGRNTFRLEALNAWKLNYNRRHEISINEYVMALCYSIPMFSQIGLPIKYTVRHPKMFF